MKQILNNYPRLKDWYDIGPVQQAELAEFVTAVCAAGTAITADHKLVNPGDQVWILAALDNAVEAVVLEPVTAYYECFGPVPVSHSFSTEQAALNYVKYNVN